MRNKAMRSRINSGEVLDVHAIGREIKPGLYELRGFVEGKGYCDGRTEQWIWSIGRRLSDGKIFASLDRLEFYQNPEFECLWLR